MVQKLTFEESRERCKQKGAVVDRYSKLVALLSVGRLLHEVVVLRRFPVNTSDVLTIESDTENRFVLEQLWPSVSPHQTVWLGMYFNTDSKIGPSTASL